MKNNHKKVLLCDSSFSVLPIFETLKLQGFFVGVCGARESDPCHAIADQSFLFDYSDKNQLLDIFRENKYDYLVPGCTDISYLSSAWVASHLKLSGFDKLEVVKLIHDKANFRAFAESHAYPTPKVAYTLDSAKKLNFPILIKPTNSFSGKGIQKVNQAGLLEEIYDTLERSNLHEKYIFEEFVSGQLFSHSAFIKNKKVILDFFVNEYCTVHPYQVNSSNLSSELSSTVKNKMRIWLETFSSHANLTDGLLHTQFISNNIDLWIIESARRCPGDLYSKLIELSTGISYSKEYIKSFCNIELSDERNVYNITPISRHTVSTNEECVFISSNLTLKNEKAFFVPVKKSGEVMKAAPYDRAGIYFIEHSSSTDMEIYTEKLFEYIHIQKLNFN